MKFLFLIVTLAFTVLAQNGGLIPRPVPIVPINSRIEKRELATADEGITPLPIPIKFTVLTTEQATFKESQPIQQNKEQIPQTPSPIDYQNPNPNDHFRPHNPKCKKHQMMGHPNGPGHQQFNHHNQNLNIPNQIQNDPFKWNMQGNQQHNLNNIKEYDENNKHNKHGHNKHGGYINENGQFISADQFGNGQQPHHKRHTLGCLLFFGFGIIVIALLIKGLKKCCKKRRCRREYQGQAGNFIDHQIQFHEQQIRRLTQHRNQTIMNRVPQVHQPYPVYPPQSFDQQRVSFVPRPVYPIQRNVPVGRPVHDNNSSFASEYPSI